MVREQKQEDRIYLIMDYCSGGDLSYYIKNRGRLPSLDFVPPQGGKPVFWPHPEEGGLDEVVVRSFLAQLGQSRLHLPFTSLRAHALICLGLWSSSSGVEISEIAEPDPSGHQASGERPRPLTRPSPVTLFADATV